MDTKIEAKEACDWLQAAGFPQYAQLYEDLLFPINVDVVKSDHEFLDQDSMDALLRRLNTLNKCATMKVEIIHHCKRSDESEDDEPCAISSKWSYQRQSKRWSRLDDLNFALCEEACAISMPIENIPVVDALDQGERNDASSLHSSSSSESDCLPKTYEDLQKSRCSSRASSAKIISPGSTVSGSPSSSEMLNVTNEKLVSKHLSKKDTLLMKMEKFRLRSSVVKRTPHPKVKPTISSPVLLDDLGNEKLRSLNCVNISDFQEKQSKTDFSSSSQTCSSSSPSENSSAMSTPSPVRVRSHMKKGGVNKEYVEPSKSSSWNKNFEQKLRNKRNLHECQIFYTPHGHKPGTFPKTITANSILSTIDNTSVNWRNGSFHGYDSNKISSNGVKDTEARLLPIDNRLSIYDNVPNLSFQIDDLCSPNDDDVFSELDNVIENINGLRKLVSSWPKKCSDDGDFDFHDSVSIYQSSPKTVHLQVKEQNNSKSELTNHSDMDFCKSHTDSYSPALPYMTISEIEAPLINCSRESPESENISMQVERQSAAHLNRIQKLSLLKLTVLMDKYSTSNKQGWNWNVPKFIRKIRVPDYKDKNVFGVPLLLNVQRTGYPIPKSILQAMEYLRILCLDQVGLFRKSGVKSRIQALREMNELNCNFVNYDGQSAFDVADMVKQYFRDLPEPIFTSKLCESFLHIYQYVPKDQQLFAAQAAILLLPDENREALKMLLYFLRDVVASASENQMTQTNIAVCLAPSLFHLNSLRRESTSSNRSSQRKYSTGKPDQKDLSENLAAIQSLAHMIAECGRLFQVPDYCLDLCLSICKPMSAPSQGTNNACTNSLAAHCNTLISLENSMQNLLRDAKDKFRSWAACAGFENVELAYKKVESNDYPIRLWKVSIELDATPYVALQYILREQHTWDPNLQQSKILETLDEDTEIYHYSIESMPPVPCKEYVVLRTWRTDPQSGTCILAATSVECEDADITGILGHVILCEHLIENIGSQKCKMTHVCRTDTRGRTSEWYNRVFGHKCATEIQRIKRSFNKN
ncbi:PREDICTED: rho GTPase-activating protein 7-like [Nanorana parkeri]|uniref:rho GTPase-activating protein 7-like n=1 Tax=Nanorana parkeri TaxID=125878 RepID=UPI0008544465|nr:PREDICTED: rho GTPase-activating protein 7-like [Nanorana parkeri]